MKYITEIAPYWSEKIDKDDYSTITIKDKNGMPIKLDIEISAFCVLGEANNFSYAYRDKYHSECDRCPWFAMEFLSLSWMKTKTNYDPITLRNKYKTNDYNEIKGKLINNFEYHWNKDHVI